MNDKVFAAVGDIHGRLDLLQALVEYLDQHYPNKTIVLLGDYVDRGPDSCDVIDFIIDRQKQYDDTVALMGNHEKLFVDYLNGSDRMCNFLWNGGLETLISYGAASESGVVTSDPNKYVPKYHLDWLKNLPVCYDTEKYFFVHAGINPDRSLDNQKEKDLLWIREYFLKTDHSRYLSKKHIVHGHTPQELDKERMKHVDRRTNLDSGACWNNVLTCGIFDNNKLNGPIMFIQAEGSHDDIVVRGINNDYKVLS